MSIEKSISPTLSNLIAEANYTIENAKDKILAVYNYAVENDKFTPQEARQLVEKKIVNVTDRYIRKILPEESKQTKFTPKGQNSNVEQVPPQEELEDGFVSKIPDENRDRSKDEKIKIETAYEMKEAESEPEEEESVQPEGQEFKPKDEPFEETQHYINQIREFDTTKQLLVQANEKIEEKDKKINELEIELAQIDRTKKKENEIDSGDYTLEIKDKIIPLLWEYNPSKPKGKRQKITFDMQKARRMGV